MLKQRVMTAVLLLMVLIPTLLHPSEYPFGVVSLVLIACAAWEWSRLVGFAGVRAVVAAAVCAALCIALWRLGYLAHQLFTLWWVVSAVWALLGAWYLYRGVAQWQAAPRFLKLVGGLGVLLAAWLALMQLRAISPSYLLSVLALVWIADVAAYFAGRAFGGVWVARKLAPSISPGKTWEGAIGGACGVLALAAAWVVVAANQAYALPNAYSVWTSQGGSLYLLLCVLLLTAMSVVGDLMESLVKRAAAVKDSSALLPGHGGVLDRIDALLPTLPLAMLLNGMGAA